MSGTQLTSLLSRGTTGRPPMRRRGSLRKCASPCSGPEMTQGSRISMSEDFILRLASDPSYAEDLLAIVCDVKNAGSLA
jgi:hypothetical protein